MKLILQLLVFLLVAVSGQAFGQNRSNPLQQHQNEPAKGTTRNKTMDGSKKQKLIAALSRSRKLQQAQSAAQDAPPPQSEPVDGSDFLTVIGQAYNLVSAGELDAATDYLDEAAGLVDPDDVEGMLLIIELELYVAGEYSEEGMDEASSDAFDAALDMAVNLLDSEPGDETIAELYLTLGYAYAGFGLPNDAYSLYTDAFKLGQAAGADTYLRYLAAEAAYAAGALAASGNQAAPSLYYLEAALRRGILDEVDDAGDPLFDPTMDPDYESMLDNDQFIALQEEYGF